MESHEKEAILKLSASNRKLRELYSEHIDLEERLEWFGNRTFLTEEEQQQAKLLKIKKLRGVDSMMQIVNSSKGLLAA